MRQHLCYVYMLASRRNGTLYVGVSNDVIRRAWEHKSDLVEGFTKKNGVHSLVWYEMHEDIRVAIERERRIYDRLTGQITAMAPPGSPSPRVADAPLGRG